MIDIYRDLLYQEIGKYVVRAIENVNFDILVEKAAIRALKDIQDVLRDESIPEEAKAAHIESAFIKNGIEGSGLYE